MLIENVQKKETEDVVTYELKSLGYTTQAFYANSASYGLPQSRTRLYVLGVDSKQCEIVHGPEMWQKWMEVGSTVFDSVILFINRKSYIFPTWSWFPTWS